jgi:hypothetical protein
MAVGHGHHFFRDCFRLPGAGGNFSTATGACGDGGAWHVSGLVATSISRPLTSSLAPAHHGVMDIAIARSVVYTVIVGFGLSGKQPRPLSTTIYI